MSKSKKYNQFLNLAQYAVWINDTDPTSRYFKISQLPDVLTGGKNAFLIHGSEELVITTDVKVELIDSAGNTVYVEPIKKYAEGNSRLVSIEVYEDTPAGLATLTILGHLKQDANGNLPPDRFANAYNVKWQTQISINPPHQNISRIRLYDEPVFTVSELLTPYRDSVPGLMDFLTGPPSTVLLTVTPSFPGNVSSSQTVLTRPTSLAFNRSMNSGSFVGSVAGKPYTSSVASVFNSQILYLSQSFTQSAELQTFPVSSFRIYFNYDDVYTVTNLSRSFADITLNRLRSFSGQIYRTKIYTKTVDQPGDYVQISDTIITPRSLLVTQSVATGDNNIDQGSFIRFSNVDNWTAGEVVGNTIYNESGVSLSLGDLILLNGMSPSPTTSYTGSLIAQQYMATPPMQFTKDNEYALSVDIVCDKSGQYYQPRMDIYLLGDAFPSSSASPLGVLVTTLYGSINTTRDLFIDTTANFFAQQTANAKMYFVTYGGTWTIANVSVISATEQGFNPDEARFFIPIMGHRLERLQFKAELFDANNNLFPVILETDPIFFNGGNVVMKGQDNMVSGVVTVGSYTGSSPSITLTSQGYTGSSGVVVGAPAIYIGNGKYNDPATPFLVGSSSQGPVMSLGSSLTFDGSTLTLVGAVRQRPVSQGGGTYTDFVNRGVWAPGNIYYINDLVQYSGSVYTDYSLAHTSSVFNNPIASASIWQAFVAPVSGGSGPPGATGPQGPGIVYRGAYNSSTAYFDTSVRLDVVQGSDNNYYYTNNLAKNGLTTWGDPALGSSDWSPFGASFSSVATDLLLAQNVNITKGLVLGGTNSIGFVRSISASISGGLGLYVDGSGSFFLGSGNNSILGDRTNLVITANRFLLNTSTVRLSSSGSGLFTMGAASDFATGTGVYMDGNGNFRVGNPSGAQFYLSGSLLRLTSLDVVDDGTTFLRVPQYGNGDNLAENANFEADLINGSVPAYSTSNASMSLDSTGVYSGTKSLKVVASAQYGAATSNRRWKVRPGEVYYVSGAIKGATTSDFPDIQFAFLDKNGGYLSGVQAQQGNVTSWTGVSDIQVVPMSASYAQLYLQNNNPAGGTVWFDDIVVLRVRDVNKEIYRYSSLTPLFNIIQQIKDTGHLFGTIQDGSGRLVSGFFHTGSDSLDKVNDGSTWVRNPQMAGGDNVIENGNFEASSFTYSGFPPGWVQRGTGTFAYETSTQYSGNQSAKITTTAANDGMTTLRKTKCSPGEIWKISGALKANTGATAAAVMVFRDANGTSKGTAGISTTSTSWTVLNTTATVPAGSVYVEVSLECTTVGGGTAWFDDLLMIRVRDVGSELYRYSSGASLAVILQYLSDLGLISDPDKFVTPYGTTYALPGRRASSVEFVNLDFEMGGTNPTSSDSGWTNPNGWTALSYETASPLGGTRSFKGTTVGDNINETRIENVRQINVQPNDKFIIRWTGKNTNPALTATVRLAYKDVAGNVSFATYGTAMTSTTTTYADQHLVPSGAVTALLEIFAFASTQVGTLTVDNIRVDRGLPGSDGTIDVYPSIFHGALGSSTGNILVNGGGQTGTENVQATGWALGLGNNLVPTSSVAQIADRSLTITNSSATDSYSYQDITVIDGEIYKLSGWIKATSLSGAGFGAVFNIDIVSGVSSFTILDKQGDDATTGQPDVGVAKANTPTSGFKFVSSTFQVNGSGTIRVYIQLGFTGTISGQAWYDGVTLEKLPPQVSKGGFRGYNALDSSNELVAGSFGRNKIYYANTKPSIIYARSSSNGAGTAAATAYANLGYNVATVIGASVQQCAQFDVVLIDAFAWSAGEHNTFIQQLLDDGQKVLVQGNDSHTDLFYITAASSSTIGVAKPNPARIHPLQQGWSQLTGDFDSGYVITGVPSYVTVINTKDSSPNIFLTLEVQTPKGGHLIHNQPNPPTSPTGDDATFLKNVVEYLGGGFVRTPKVNKVVNQIYKYVGSQGDNLINNPGGQDGPLNVSASGWTQNAGAVLITTADDSIVGDRSLKITSTGGDNNAYQRLSLTAGYVYALTGWMKSTALATNDLALFFVTSSDGGSAPFFIFEKVSDAYYSGNTYGANYTPSVGFLGNGTTRGWTYFQSVWYQSANADVDVYCRAFTTGSQTVWFDDVSVVQLPPQLANRVYNTIVGSGQFASSSAWNDGIGRKPGLRGALKGFVSQSQPVTFSVSFVNVPQVIFGGGGIIYEPRAKWGTSATIDSPGVGSTAMPTTSPIYNNTQAIFLTRQAFGARLRLWAKASTTPVSANFPGGNSLTTVGATTTSTALSSAPGSSDQYTITFDATIEADRLLDKDGSATVTVAIDSDPTGVGSWTEQWSNSYSVTETSTNNPASITYANQSATLTIPGFTSSGVFRIRIKSLTHDSGVGAVTTVHGHASGESPAGVTYTTSTGDLYANRTPDSGDSIEWTAVELNY